MFSTTLQTSEGVLDEAAWERHWETREPVGTCRCGGIMQVIEFDGAPYEDVHGLRYFGAECLLCGQEQYALSRREMPTAIYAPRRGTTRQRKVDTSRWAVDPTRPGEALGA